MNDENLVDVPHDIYNHARCLWDFHLQRDELKPVDALFVMGSNDLDVPRYAIELFQQGLAPLLILSGGAGNFTDGIFERAEADIFADMARDAGLVEDELLLENRSTNSGENILFTQGILNERRIKVASLIAVQKPFMGKRVRASLAKQWPDVEALVTSAPAEFTTYKGGHKSMKEIIHVMVGDLHRILTYPKAGYQVELHVPTQVMRAYHALVDAGYTGHM